MASRDDADTRCKNVEKCSEVGERRSRIVRRRRTDRDGRRFRSRGNGAGVAAVVARCHHHGDAIGNRIGNRTIQRRIAVATQTEVGNGGNTRRVILDHPIDAGNDTEDAAPARTRQHTNGNDRDGFGHTNGLAADGTGNVRAVPVAVFGATSVADLRISSDNAPTELPVVTAHSGIDDVRVHARPREVVGVVAVTRDRPLVDAIESPRRWICLVGFDAHDGIFFDKHDVGIARQARQL